MLSAVSKKFVDFHTRESGAGVFLSSALLFLPFFTSKIAWGTENEFFFLFTHIPQAIIIALICAINLLHTRPNKRQMVVIIVCLCLLLVHLIQSIYLYNSLPDYSGEYFTQGLVLWAYIFAVCLYASSMSVEIYPRLLKLFDFFAKSAVLGAIFFYLLYKVSGIALFIHFYEGFDLARIQGFLSEPSAFAPIACWLLLSGIRKKSPLSVGLAIAVCVLTFSPIVIISTLLSVVTYVLIFYPRASPLIFFMGFMIALWITLVDCSVLHDGSSFGRAACGVKSVYDEDTRAHFSNERLLSSIAIFEYLSSTDAWLHGLGINSTSVFMPAYFGEMRDNSLLISILAFYGLVGCFIFILLAFFLALRARHRRNIHSIFWISFFWCAMINSAQGFITYSLLFVASIFLFNSPHQENSVK